MVVNSVMKQNVFPTVSSNYEKHISVGKKHYDSLGSNGGGPCNISILTTGPGLLNLRRGQGNNLVGSEQNNLNGISNSVEAISNVAQPGSLLEIIEFTGMNRHNQDKMQVQGRRERSKS